MYLCVCVCVIVASISAASIRMLLHNRGYKSVKRLKRKLNMAEVRQCWGYVEARCAAGNPRSNGMGNPVFYTSSNTSVLCFSTYICTDVHISAKGLLTSWTVEHKRQMDAALNASSYVARGFQFVLVEHTTNVTAFSISLYLNHIIETKGVIELNCGVFCKLNPRSLQIFNKVVAVPFIC